MRRENEISTLDLVIVTEGDDEGEVGLTSTKLSITEDGRKIPAMNVYLYMEEEIITVPSHDLKKLSELEKQVLEVRDLNRR